MIVRRQLKSERRECWNRLRSAFKGGKFKPQNEDGSLKFEVEDLQDLLALVPAGIDAQIDSIEEQRLVDEARRKQASSIIGHPKTIEEAAQLAINWCETAMQETCNADYWKERAKEAESRLQQFDKAPRGGS